MFLQYFFRCSLLLRYTKLERHKGINIRYVSFIQRSYLLIEIFELLIRGIRRH